MKITTTIFCVMAAVFSAIGSAQADENDVRQALAIKYPGTPIKAIETTPIPGLYQMVMGKNLVYVAEGGRYFLFGSLYDMQTQTDLSANKREQANRIDISTIPLKNAIVTVKGSGERKLIVFTDPDCPYCKRLAQTLDAMTDITVYNILYPIEGLHPDAARKSQAIYCAREQDRERILNDWFVKAVPVPTSKPCSNPTSENVALAASLGLNGTPMIISMDGRILPGAAERAQIEEFLAQRQ